MKLLEIAKKGIHALSGLEDGSIPVYKTGIPVIDKYIAVIAKSLNFICARPGHGKTHLMLTAFKNMIYKYKVCYYSGEDDSINFYMRMLNTLFGNIFTMKEAYQRKITKQQWLNINAKLAKLENSHILKNANILTSAGWCVDKAIKSFQIMEQHGCQIIIYDYVQLLKTADNGNTFKRQTEVVEKLTDFFSSSKMALWGVLQVNRNSNDDPNKMPRLSDIFGSGSYEKDAFSVTMINRMYEEDLSNPTGYSPTGKYGLLIRKNRGIGECPSLVVDKNYNISLNEQIKKPIQNKDYRNYAK